MDADKRAAMLDQISSVLAYCISSLAVILDVSHVVLGGFTIDVLGDDTVVELVRQKAGQITPFPLKISTPLARMPGISGVAQKVFDLRLNGLLAK
jgi:hypothetical protein